MYVRNCSIGKVIGSLYNRSPSHYSFVFYLMVISPHRKFNLSTEKMRQVFHLLEQSKQVWFH